MINLADLAAALASISPPAAADQQVLLDAWHDARDEATLAYLAWGAAQRSRAGEAFAVYVAAEAREAAAADALRRWAEHACE